MGDYGRTPPHTARANSTFLANIKKAETTGGDGMQVAPGIYAGTAHGQGAVRISPQEFYELLATYNRRTRDGDNEDAVFYIDRAVRKYHPELADALKAGSYYTYFEAKRAQK